MGRMSDSGHGGRTTLTVYVGDGLGTNVKHQCIHQGYVIAGSWFIGYLKIKKSMKQENKS